MGTPRKKENEARQDYLKRCTEARVAGGDDVRTAFSKCAAKLSVDGGLVLSAPVQMMAADGQETSRRFLIVAKTGQPVSRWGYTTAIDIQGMQTEARMPILREHMRDRVVGSGQAFIDGDKLMVEGEFSKITADAQEVVALSDEGYPWQASIGVWAKEMHTLQAGESEKVNGVEIQGPADVWTKSFVREVSFVTLGADEATAAIALAADTEAGINPTREDKTMDMQELREKYPELVAEIDAEGQAKGFSDGVIKERERVSEILAADADPEQTKQAISAGTPAGDAYKAFFEAEKAKRARGLAEMAADATPAQGQDHNAADEAVVNPDRELAKQAAEIARAEGISIAAAIKRVARANPAMTAKALPKIHVVNG
jgi:hypothetical protein